MSIEATNKGSDGFFGSIFSAVGEGLSQGLQGALPIWTANQLGVQTQDQLAQPTYIPANAPPPINPTPTTAPTQAGLLFDNLQVNSTGLLVGAAAIVAVLMVARGR